MGVQRWKVVKYEYFVITAGTATRLCILLSDNLYALHLYTKVSNLCTFLKTHLRLLYLKVLVESKSKSCFRR